MCQTKEWEEPDEERDNPAELLNSIKCVLFDVTVALETGAVGFKCKYKVGQVFCDCLAKLSAEVTAGQDVSFLIFLLLKA